jgi:hypothetical protein
MSDRTVLSFLVKEGGSIQSYETSSSELFQTDNHIPASTVKTADNGPLTPPPAPTRGSRDQPTCFRISGVPSSWTMANLEHAIKTIDSEFSIDEVELSLFPACCDSTQTALLNLNYSTAYFQGFERNDERLEIIRENGRKIRLSIDKHFYDWTPMNTPQAPIVAEFVQSDTY